jgi:prevent-host-death family protein
MQNVSAHDAKARFGQLLDTVRREPVVIERHGRAVAVVLSKEEYDELNDIKLQQLRAEINLGIADLESGAHSDYKADELPELAERIKAAGRERLAKK